MKDEKMYLCLRWDNAFWACLVLMNTTVMAILPYWLKMVGITCWGVAAALCFLARRILEKKESGNVRQRY